MVRGFATLLATLLGLGCAGDIAPAGETAIALSLPAGLSDEVQLLLLTVYDETATCSTSMVSGGTPLSGLEDIELGPSDSQSLAVSPGRRTFAANGLDIDSMVIATGCVTVDLEEGRDPPPVRITMERVGGADAGVTN